MCKFHQKVAESELFSVLTFLGKGLSITTQKSQFVKLDELDSNGHLAIQI